MVSGTISRTIFETMTACYYAHPIGGTCVHASRSAIKLTHIILSHPASILISNSLFRQFLSIVFLAV